MQLEALKLDKNIRNIAKANVLLLEEVKDTRQFVELFNRNFSQRIHEHLSFIDTTINQVISLNEASEALYIQLPPDLKNENVQTLVKEQFAVEMKKRKALLQLDEHIEHVNKLFNVLHETNYFLLNESVSHNKMNNEGDILLESAMVEENTEIRENHTKYATCVKSNISVVTKSLLEKFNGIVTSLDDIATSALTSLKSNSMNEEKQSRETYDWWKQSLNSKEKEFRGPKNTLMNLQKVIILTEQELASQRLVM